MNKQWSRFLIVSGGSIGTRHAQNLSVIYPKAEIIILHLKKTASVNDDVSDDGYQHIYHIDDAIDIKPEAAFVCAPASSHVSVALALCKAGIPLFIEKPISDKLNDFYKLSQAARELDVPIAVGYHLRFEPCFDALQSALDNKQIGEVLYVRAEVGQFLPHWRPQTDYRHSVSARKELGGGALLELSHELDYILALFGMPNDISAFGGHLSDLEIDVEDCVDIIATYASQRPLINIHLDFLQHSASRYCKIIGTLGEIYWDLLKRELWVYTNSSGWSLISQSAGQSNNDVYIDEIKDFLDCVEQSKQTRVTLEQAGDALALAEAAKESLTSRATQKVKVI